MNLSLSDLLNYAHCIDEGIILNKDGAFLQTYSFQGPDFYSSTQEQIEALTLQFNRMLTFLGDAWLIHLDAMRTPSISYPDSSEFPHPILTMIDAERQQFFNTHSEHYENRLFISFIWKYPTATIKKSKLLFAASQDDGASLNTLLNEFKETVERCVGVLSSELSLSRLNSQEQLMFLNTCINGEFINITPPASECYLDILLGKKALSRGTQLRIEEKNIYLLSITGYLNSATTAGLLNELSNYPLIYRWSNRFITLSSETAAREMKKFQKNWNNKVKGFAGIVREVLTGKTSNSSNNYAAEMSQEINSALSINNNNSVRFGYWTSVIVLMHEQIPILDNAKKNLRQYLEQNGFSCYLEDVNALEAFLGSIPGHGACNARRLFLSSLNLAHVLPLFSIWPGAKLKENTVFNASSPGKTPFRFPLDIEGVGHQIVIGPTGSGKSTYLDFLIAQFFRFKNAQVFIFDRDFSHQGFTQAVDGYFYNLGDSRSLTFCPFAELNNTNDVTRATQFLENLLTLQKLELTPTHREAIYQALVLCKSTKHCSLSVIRAQIQNTEVREALSYYTQEGPMPLLDGVQDSLKMGFLQTFETSWLLQQKPEIYLPLLFHLFNQIEKRLEPRNGLSRPSLIILEEAWQYISHPLFSAKLIEWLKTLRKKNARVIFATQSLVDLYDPISQNLTATTAQILESCPIRLFLPNNKMDTEIRKLYQNIGLNPRQIELISQIAIPKKDYYLTTPAGQRLFELDLHRTPLAKAFINLSSQDSFQLSQCKNEYPCSWMYHWLRKQDLIDWAEYWQNNFSQKEGN